MNPSVELDARSFLHSSCADDTYREICMLAGLPRANRVKLEQKGIVKSQLLNFQRLIGLEVLTLANIIGISPRYFYYLNLKDRLSPKAIPRLMAVMYLYSDIYATFDNREYAHIWVSSPARELNWEAPVKLMPYMLCHEEIKRFLRQLKNEKAPLE